MACGPAGLVVIDIDAHPKNPPARDRLLPGISIGDHVDLTGLENGFHTLAVLAALRDTISPADDESTLRVRTPSGGLHVWYRATDGRRWQCSAGSSSGRALAWQVDVRAHGGYIIAPGTTTDAGMYTPVGAVQQPAPLPAWLAQELERTGHLPASPASTPHPLPPRAFRAVIAAGGGHDRATSIMIRLVAEVASCASAPEGTGFSEKLNRAAYTMGGLVAAGHFTQADAERALEEAAALARPDQRARTARIIHSAMRTGFQRPLYLRKCS